MKILSLLFAALLASIGQADSNDNSESPKRYQPFQGEWRLVSIEGKDSPAKEIPDVSVKVTGEKFQLSGKGLADEAWKEELEFRIPKSKEDNPFRQLREHGATSLDDILDVENQIMVFWFVGVFKITDDKLELALKYCGQGLEGVHFKNFRPPSAFDEKPTEGEVRLVLQKTAPTKPQ